MLYSNGMDAKRAYAALDSTLSDVRDSAFDVMENLKWGTNKQDHKAFLGVLSQEGVKIGEINERMKEQRESMKIGADAVVDWSDVVQVGIAYSRQFGVGLQDIASF